MSIFLLLVPIANVLGHSIKQIKNGLSHTTVMIVFFIMYMICLCLIFFDTFDEFSFVIAGFSCYLAFSYHILKFCCGDNDVVILFLSNLFTSIAILTTFYKTIPNMSHLIYLLCIIFTWCMIPDS